MIAGRERGLFLAVISLGSGCISFGVGTWLETQNNPSKRYISKDEARAAKMFGYPEFLVDKMPKM